VRRCWFWVALALLLSSQICQAAPGDPLQSGFLSPPPSARPRVWWHWLHGNVTEEGIQRDLEWMDRIGIGGIQKFDVAFEPGSSLPWAERFALPRLVDKPLPYLSAGWEHALRYSVSRADQLGLEFTIASSPGWSITGGPWVKPPQAMKKLVWSETLVRGGKPFNGILPKPPDVAGPFQTIPLTSIGAQSVDVPPRPVHYVDVAVVAYRAPAAGVQQQHLAPHVTTSGGAIDAGLLSDGNLWQSASLLLGEKSDAWVEYSFKKPQRIQAVTFMIGHPLGRVNAPRTMGWLESSNDGQRFRKVVDLPRNDVLQQTVSFPPTTARVFRVVLRPPVRPVTEPGPKLPLSHIQLAELVLHTDARVNRFEDKAGYSTRQIEAQDDTPGVAAKDAIRRDSIVDLTQRMNADGSLNWTPPAGDWVIMRFGYSLTGRTNHPESREGVGLEVDKLSRTHVEAYIHEYLRHYEAALGPALMGRKGLEYLLVDSYEAGAQNWTDDMLKQFQQRRGYDAKPWLPVLAGRVVDGAQSSDRFLWDFRKTLGDLIADAHYGQISESAHRRGLGVYGESHEIGRALIGDGMQVKKMADIPMGAIWTAPSAELEPFLHDADIRESASVAHIYGQNLVAAESFTAFGNTYGFAPEMLKPLADRAMAVGLNRFVIHTSVHQPEQKVGPGISLGKFGQWFTRNEVWAEQASGWIQYLTRSCYLLQQGRFVADIAYLYGEDTNLTALFGASAPDIPPGYNFDFVNSDALLNEFAVAGSTLITRQGMQYRVLVLDKSTRHISVPVLRKIRDLARAGAVVVGARPLSTPSLADDEREFEAIVAELWGTEPRAGRALVRQSLPETLQSLQLPPDVMFSTSNAELRFVHRRLDGQGDVYFLSSSARQPQTIDASFRVSGKKPELWRADSGTIMPLSYRLEQGRTVVPLSLEANDAVFVVFREAANADTVAVSEPTREVLTTIGGPWEVSFPPNLGAPANASFDTLRSWTESADAGVKYFSGTATYTRTVHVQRDWLNRKTRVQINLGDVKNVAEVIVNGRSMSTLWKTPFRADITDALKAGDNRIEIKVSNLWPNRLIGDKQPGAHVIAFASFDPYTADSPLLPSGLLGPVRLVRVTDGSVKFAQSAYCAVATAGTAGQRRSRCHGP
jgi:alpha-L-rhamnosidase/Glycosyl hydrolases family 2, sugar binding domain